MRTICLTLALLPFVVPSFVTAAEEPPRGGSVYRINPAADIPALIVGSLGATIPLFFESQLIHQKCPCVSNDVNSFDRPVIGNHDATAGRISDFTVALSLVAPIALDAADQGFNKTLAEDLLVFTEALSIDSAVSHIARYSVQRARPVAYQADPPETRPGEFLSFYSGHSASVFAGLSAASMTYGYRYGHKVWPWLVTAGVGLGESALRVAAGRHFYTDVIAGAVMGTAVGTLVPYFHRRYRGSSLTLVPTGDDAGVQLVWRKNF